jgi:AcrR family transcriptional regulator
MSSPAGGPGPDAPARRTSVLESALLTFARLGYRRTSMDEVARAARISRQGLYFLFSSKEALFRAAVTQALDRDLATVERLLAQQDRPLADRLLGAFDTWAGRYTGPLAREVTTLVDDHPDLLGPVVETAPRRFAELVTGALAATADDAAATRVAQTLISTSIGVKHQVDSPAAYRARMEVALDLLLTGAPARTDRRI